MERRNPPRTVGGALLEAPSLREVECRRQRRSATTARSTRCVMRPGRRWEERDGSGAQIVPPCAEGGGGKTTEEGQSVLARPRQNWD